MLKKHIDVIMMDLLRDNKKTEDDKYKLAYIDGVLDFYNKISPKKKGKR